MRGDNSERARRFGVVSEVINLRPSEGIRKFAKEIAKTLRQEFFAEVHEFGLPLDRIDDDAINEISRWVKLKWILSVRNRLKKADPDVLIYIPSSPRFFTNILKIRLWRDRIPRAILILLQPPEGIAPFAKRLLGDTKLLAQSDSVSMSEKFPALSFGMIPSGVDTEEFVPASPAERRKAKEALNIPAEEKVVLTIGHQSRLRNLELISEIADDIDARFVFVSSELHDEDSDLDKELRNAGVLTIRKFLPNIREAYAAADCYLFPTVHTSGAIGIPLSILEAMSMNLPVVLSHFNNLKNIIEETSGIFYFKDSQEALSCIDQALKVREVSTREIAMRYDWKSVIDKIMMKI